MAQSSIVGQAGSVKGTTDEPPRSKRTEPESRRSSRGRRARGLAFERRYTRPGADPMDQVVWERRESVITNPDGSVVFRMEGAEIPAAWSQLATDIVVSASTSARRGCTATRRRAKPACARSCIALPTPSATRARTSAATSRRKKDADTFEAELTFLLVNQYGAFNSPVWFNCGLYHEYGIEGSGGNWAWNPEPDAVDETTNAYEHPQCSACFIQGVEDDLMSIYDLMKSEARLFKYGSGTGSNFSNIRGKQEKLSGGGTSSGLMSFLEVFDRAAGSTKSGGTTRRAAKMVCLDMDHPEIADFINWKVREEKKAQALIAAGFESDFNGEAYRTVSGQNSNNSIRVTDEFMKAALLGGKWQTRARTTGEVVDTYDAADLWQQVAEAAWACADPGVQYDTTINRWHTCPNTGRINASNPCSEYMFLDNTACNLASLNLTKFLREDGSFDVDGYRHAIERVLHGAGNPRGFLQLPDAGHRAELARLPSAGARLRQPRHAADAARHSLRLGQGSRGGRRAHRHPVRPRLRDEREDGREQGAVPGLRQEPRADAARDAHAPGGGLRHQPRRVSRSAVARRLRGLGRRRQARRAARLPQRAGHGARTHRHHRPA